MSQKMNKSISQQNIYPKGLLLNRAMLTNWLYYEHILLDIGSVTGFQGDTGSGKSAICDAFLFCMTSNPRGNYFNKAANDEGKRTLDGYLRGMMRGTEGQQVQYIRSGTFSTHIAMEFIDHYRDRYVTQLIVIDTINDTRDKIRYFTYDGQIPENEFITDDVPMNTNQVRKYLQAWRGAKNISDNTSGSAAYKETQIRLGSIGDFAPLMYKAAAFDPSINYDKFFKEYVCKAGQSVDIKNLVARYQSLLRLREQARITALQVEELIKLEEVLGQMRRAEWNVNVHEYMEKLLLELNAKDNVNEQKKQNETFEKRLESLKQEEIDLSNQLQKARFHSAELQARLNTDESRRQVSELKEKISGLNALIKERSSKWREQSLKMSQLTTRLSLCFSDCRKKSFYQTPVVDSTDLQNLLKQLEKSVQNIRFSSADQAMELEDHLNLLEEQCDALNQESISLSSLLKAEINKFADTLDSKTKELADAKKGIVHFPKQTVELKRRITESFASRGIDPHITIVGEVTQITNDRWRNAIEGYLNNQKTNLIIDEEYFEEAEPIMKEYRAELQRKHEPLRVQVVDVRKVKEKMLGKSLRPGTLACEVSSDDNRVDLYVKWLLGNVFECDTVAQMRQHDIAVKDDCMIYRGAALGSLNYKSWQLPLIGSGAAALRVLTLEREIEELKKEQFPYLHNFSISQLIQNTLRQISSVNSEHFIHAAAEASSIPECEQKISDLENEITHIDTSTYDSNFAEYNELIKKIDRLEKIKNSCIHEHGQVKGKLEAGRDALIQKSILLEEKTRQKEEEGAQHPDVVAEGEKRFEQRIAKNESRETMQNNFNSTRARNRRDAERYQSVFEDLQQKFNDSYHLGLRLTDEKDEFAQKLEELETSGLPESQEKLAQFEKETKDEFKQGVLDKIRGDIESCRHQIHLLNGFLGKSEFQGRTYSILIQPHPHHKKLYDAIMDRDSMEKDPEHWEEIMREKHGDVLDILYEDLFSSNEMGDSEAAEQMYYKLLDYRNYIAVDMRERTIDANGQVLQALLSRDAKVFSGGEGQLPFYLVILASAMMQYRVGVDAAENTIRVVFFDEAFSKMSANLIPTSIQMARKMGLQPIIFMPKLDPELLPSTEYLYYIAKNSAGLQPDILPFAELKEYMEPINYEY